MANPNHNTTPGPWRVESEKTRDGSYIVSKPNRKDGTPFTSYWVAFVGPCCNEDKANADLIASAPELLEALKQIVWKTSGNFAMSNYRGPAYVTREDITVKMAIAAIAKAEGKA